MKTLAELRAMGEQLGLAVPPKEQANKEAWIDALRRHLWEKDHPGQPLPPQVQPMLLSEWNDLSPMEAEELESDHHAWIAQEKVDGVRALLHVEPSGVRITGRTVSEVHFRLSEFQENLAHLQAGWDRLVGTVIDGELLCPTATVDTGKCRTADALQATTAILSTSPDNAQHIQDRHGAHLRFHAFDILKHLGADATALPLIERLSLLIQAVRMAGNIHVEIVPSYAVNKPAVHRSIVNAGGEGTVWKKCDQPYQPGRRVRHWLKRKRSTAVEAFVTGHKPGSEGKGHSHLVGAIEFSIREPDGRTTPIAWVSNWTDKEREAMTTHDPAGSVMLCPAYLGRRAMITGQNLSGKSRRIRHARIHRWVDR
jgi:ATP-dependent DNA ligase